MANSALLAALTLTLVHLSTMVSLSCKCPTLTFILTEDSEQSPMETDLPKQMTMVLDAHLLQEVRKASYIHYRLAYLLFSG
jgi:hypothetical protein